MSMIQPDTPDQGASTADPMELLQHAVELLQAALVHEQDPADSQAIAACIKQLYSISSARQKEQDGLLGNPGLARTLRRS